MSRRLKSIPCPFKDCQTTWESQRLLRRHKMDTPEHDYCRGCDEDFEDYDSFLLHKIQSGRHISCPVCGEDFKSHGGKRLHVHQMHANKQRLQCVGCGKVVDRASHLIGHIESNECPVIGVEMMAKRRAQKELLAEFLANPEAYTQDDEALSVEQAISAEMGLGSDAKSGSPKSADRSSDSSEDGGVPLPADVTAVWPQLAPKQDVSEATRGMLVGLENLQLREAAKPGGGLWASKLFPTAAAKPPNSGAAGEAEGSTPALRSESDDRKEQANPWDPTSHHFQAEQFFNLVTRRYICPHRFCGAALRSARALTQHLLSPAHLSDQITCPGCLRRFKSTTALIQHCEAPSNRCTIRWSDDYNKALDTITGGLLETNGCLEDGTPRYKAAKPTW